MDSNEILERCHEREKAYFDLFKTMFLAATDEGAKRQDRIDKTAVAIVAASFTDHESRLQLSGCYIHSNTNPLDLDCDAAYRFATALELARERAIEKEKS